MLFSINGFAQSSTYLYAYGSDSVHIYWDYSGDNIEELLGCDVWRYVTLSSAQGTKVNQELVTSPDKNFSFTDTSVPNDTTIFFYVVKYIFPEDTISLAVQMLEYVDFTQIGPSLILLSARPKKNDFYSSYIIIDGSLISATQDSGTYQRELDPYELEYIGEGFIFAYDYGKFNNGEIFTSISHLKELLSVEVPGNLTGSQKILESYPNPIQEKTIIEATIREKDDYLISIYNQNGKKIKTLIERELPAGTYRYMWNRIDDSGTKVPSGVYYAVISSNRIRETIKLVVL